MNASSTSRPRPDVEPLGAREADHPSNRTNGAGAGPRTGSSPAVDELVPLQQVLDPFRHRRGFSSPPGEPESAQICNQGARSSSLRSPRPATAMPLAAGSGWAVRRLEAQARGAARRCTGEWWRAGLPYLGRRSRGADRPGRDARGGLSIVRLAGGRRRRRSNDPAPSGKEPGFAARPCWSRDAPSIPPASTERPPRLPAQIAAAVNVVPAAAFAARGTGLADVDGARGSRLWGPAVRRAGSAGQPRVPRLVPAGPLGLAAGLWGPRSGPWSPEPPGGASGARAGPWLSPGGAGVSSRAPCGPSWARVGRLPVSAGPSGPGRPCACWLVAPAASAGLCGVLGRGWAGLLSGALGRPRRARPGPQGAISPDSPVVPSGRESSS